MEIKPANSFFKAARLFYFIAIVSYMTCLLFFLPDNLKYDRWGIIKIDSITSVFIYISLCLYLIRKLSFKNAVTVYAYSALFNILLSSWVYHYILVDSSEIILICTSIYCINQVVAGLCINYRHTFYAALLYIGFIGPIMILSKGTLLHQYGMIICLLIAAFAIGISGFIYLLEKNHQSELQIKEQLNLYEKFLAAEQSNKFKNQLEHKQKEILTKSMYLAEYAENNNTLIHKLRDLKTTLESNEQKQVNAIISTHSLNHEKQHWQDFETSFIEIEQEFLNKLVAICAELSPAESKLAKLIHLGLSSKQIAALNACTPQSVDVARSRLKNKLQLPSTINLKTYLMNM